MKPISVGNNKIMLQNYRLYVSQFIPLSLNYYPKSYEYNYLHLYITWSAFFLTIKCNNLCQWNVEQKSYSCWNGVRKCLINFLTAVISNILYAFSKWSPLAQYKQNRRKLYIWPLHIMCPVLLCEVTLWHKRYEPYIDKHHIYPNKGNAWESPKSKNSFLLTVHCFRLIKRHWSSPHLEGSPAPLAPCWATNHCPWEGGSCSEGRHLSCVCFLQ